MTSKSTDLTVLKTIEPVMLGPNITGNGIVRCFPSSDPADHGLAFGFDAYTGALRAVIEDYRSIPATPPVSTRTGPAGIEFDASRSNPIYSKASTVQPQSLILNAIIKY